MRAFGPFGHPILAGTVGGVCLPIMMGLWNSNRVRAGLGTLACVTIILCSASSGPVLTAIAGVFAVYLWRYRRQMRTVKWIAVGMYVLLDLVMKDPAYFIVARVDLVGGSTSWYRARLIQSAFEHLPEWWLAGTDNTREWMWVVVSWSAKHTDITSHYIQLGVWGGLPLMLLFLLMLWKGFAGVAHVVQQESSLPSNAAFQMWTLGATLFALAATGLSVSYFDQTFVFVFLVLGAISSASVSPAARDHAKRARTRPLGLCPSSPRRPTVDTSDASTVAIGNQSASNP